MNSYEQRLLDMAIADRERLTKELSEVEQYIERQQKLSSTPELITEQVSPADTGRSEVVLQVLRGNPDGLKIAELTKLINDNIYAVTAQQISTTVFNLKKRGKIREEDRHYFVA